MRHTADREAAVWFRRLSQSITTAALWEFHEWRQKDENRAAYRRLEVRVHALSGHAMLPEHLADIVTREDGRPIP